VQLVRQPVQRAIVLLGARRVGKTTLLRQLIREANQSRDLGPVLYASVDAPTYSGLGLDDLLQLFEEVHPHDARAPRLVVFDEVQYLPDWERHLKGLVDTYPQTRFIASGSAGAALKRKSTEWTFPPPGPGSVGGADVLAIRARIEPGDRGKERTDAPEVEPGLHWKSSSRDLLATNFWPWCALCALELSRSTDGGVAITRLARDSVVGRVNLRLVQKSGD
jgi:hypothetical protein